MGLLYTSMKIFHFKEKLDSLSQDQESLLAPLHIRIKPTNVCNHKCAYCAYRAEGLQLGQDMDVRDSIPKEKMMEIIDDVIAMGVKAVTFSGGGEPLCYPHLVDAVKKLASSPVEFATLTNGSRLQGELAEIFAHKARWVRVSMDGWDGKSYSQYRGVSDDEYGIVIENIRNFKRLGGACYLGVSFIVDKTNHLHLYEVIERLHDVGVDSVKVSPCIVSNTAIENNQYHHEMFKKVKDLTAQAVSDFSGAEFEIFDSYHEMDSKFDKSYSWCPYQQILMVIGADCNVYSCQDKAYNNDCGKLGSIKKQSFKEFWYSDKEKFFTIDPSKYCNHHCVANNRNKLVLEYLNADRDHLGFV